MERMPICVCKTVQWSLFLVACWWNEHVIHNVYHTSVIVLLNKGIIMLFCLAHMNLRFMRNFLALCCPLFIRLYTFRGMYNCIYSTQYLQEIICFAQFTNIFDRVTSRVAFILKLIWLVIIFYTIETFMFSVSPCLLNDMGFFNIYLTFLLFVYYHNCKEKTIISYILYNWH